MWIFSSTLKVPGTLFCVFYSYHTDPRSAETQYEPLVMLIIRFGYMALMKNTIFQLGFSVTGTSGSGLLNKEENKV